MIDSFLYDETSPTFLRWAISPSKQIKAGMIAGSPASHNGYFMVQFKRKRVPNHKVVWEMHFGKVPNKMFVDHIDGNKTNNKISNLRLATSCQNNQNIGLRVSNTSGYKGVTYNKAKNKWVAKITAFGKSYFFGYFDNKEDAHLVVINKRKLLHGEFSRS